MEESRIQAETTFYDKVYEADRPELFFSSPFLTGGCHGEYVYIRKDSKWNVPEPELTLFINSKGDIQGYTVAMDMSSGHRRGESPVPASGESL